MNQEGGSRYVPGYDLFKLIVAIILTIILIILLLKESQIRFAELEMTVTERAVLPTMTSQAPPSPTPSLPATPTEISAAVTVTVTVTSTSTQTEVAPATPTPTTSPEPTPSTTAQPPVSNECPSNPTRIQVGATVRVLDWLNFRTGPGLNNSIQRTNKPGTEMEVIGGPVCTIRGDDPPKAYLWWNVRMKDGREGWSAEAPLNFPNYFLEPVQ